MVGFWRISKRLPPPCLDGDSTRRKLFQPRRYRSHHREVKNIVASASYQPRDRLFPSRREEIRSSREGGGGGGTRRVMRMRLGRLSKVSSCLLFSNLLLLIEHTSAFHFTKLYTVGTRHFGRLTLVI